MNFVKSSWRYYNLVRNAKVTNKGESVFANVDPKIGCHGNVPWASEKGTISVIHDQICIPHSNNLVRIGPVDPEIILLKSLF